MITESMKATELAKSIATDMLENMHHDEWPDGIDDGVATILDAFPDASESWAEETIEMFLEQG